MGGSMSRTPVEHYITALKLQNKRLRTELASLQRDARYAAFADYYGVSDHPVA